VLSLEVLALTKSNSVANVAMLDPFKLFLRLILLGFKIAGYAFACAAQSLWYVAHGKNEMVGDAIGYLGRDITNAIADVFER
jgi:hypothetical protein